MIGKSLDIGSSVIRFFSKNFYTLILFALVLISAFSSIWLFYFEIVKDTNPLSSIPAHIVKTLFDAMVLMSPFFVVKRRGFVFIPLILLDVFCLSAVWYYRNYLDIIPFSSFLLYENLTPLLLESAFASARWIDCLAIVPTLMTGVFYKFVLQKRVQKERRRLWWPVIVILSVFVCFHIFLSVRDIKSKQYDSLTDRFVTFPNNILYFDLNGMCGYILYHAATSLLPQPELTEEETIRIQDYLDAYPRYADNIYSVNENKNLILIIVESLNSWVIGKSFCGEEITPCLNRIVNDSNSITAVHVLPQVKDGRSSDGQFMFNTGLLPLKSGAVATRYDDVDYYSIAKALKRRNYTAVNMTVDGNNYWNQAEISVAYGYDQNIDRLGGGTSVTDSVLMERLAAESEGAQAAAYGSDVVARACLLQLLAGLNRFALAAPARHEVEDKAGPVVAEVLHYINEHYPDELSLDLLSAKFFISKYHLSHEFHRLVGTSVYRYIIQKRLVIAKQMLANGVAPTDVYGHCGFGDYANFYRAFKAEYHISPKQFLGRAGNENTFGG